MKTERVIEPMMRQKALDHRDSLLILSESRSGTTWLLEMLKTIPNSATIFEPLHVYYGSYSSSCKYSWGSWLDPKNKSVEILKDWQDLLTGRRLSSYSLSRGKMEEYKSAKQLIIKMIYATSHLPWICENLNLKKKPILLLRHPLAVAKSSIEVIYKSGKEISIETQWKPEGEILELFNRNIDLFSNNKSSLERAIARWCINNYHALQMHKEDKYILVYYEEMLMNPYQTIEMIFDIWNIQIPKEIFKGIEKPSSSDFNKDFRKNKKEQLSKWHTQVDPKEYKKLHLILDRFEFSHYEISEIMPLVSCV